jgi:hypothetical protein
MVRLPPTHVRKAVAFTGGRMLARPADTELARECGGGATAVPPTLRTSQGEVPLDIAHWFPTMRRTARVAELLAWSGRSTYLRGCVRQTGPSRIYPILDLRSRPHEHRARFGLLGLRLVPSQRCPFARFFGNDSGSKRQA